MSFQCSRVGCALHPRHDAWMVADHVLVPQKSGEIVQEVGRDSIEDASPKPSKKPPDDEISDRDGVTDEEAAAAVRSDAGFEHAQPAGKDLGGKIHP